ncbi:MAG: hypothetical protein IJ678_09565 [Kiritimatiellae bacterium]|nr:hypothetical protein [Kiritimatiellia bacterium]
MKSDISCHCSKTASSNASTKQTGVGAEKGCLCGCLFVIGLYFLVGLSYVGTINWATERWYIPAYVLAPFIWPVAIAWLFESNVVRTVLALSGLAAYAFILKTLFAHKSRKAVVWSSVGLLLLFILALGGCGMELDRSFG